MENAGLDQNDPVGVTTNSGFDDLMIREEESPLTTKHSRILEEQKAKKLGLTDVQAQKRKALQEKKRILVQVSMSLERDADKLAEDADGKAGTLMAQLITKSNQPH
ncbi:hypothetical protein C0J50_18943 [Silurus asotus]|uniref:Uncharacterized protein n=1 Tax=Silurus asotus TaxID=30991 RepID=A0AAD5ATN1_SILAS|nr:hypothetical protein C0J50_18943 [Silurus asotus]